MISELADDIAALVERIEPASVLLIGDTETTPLRADNRTVWHLKVEQALDGLADLGYHDLGIFIDDNDLLNRRRKEPLISGLRDLYTRRFMLALPEAGPEDHAHWDDTQMIAFGLTEIRRYDNGWRLFEYNILNYKQTPDWLNARNWANPEMWGKYRW